MIRERVHRVLCRLQLITTLEDASASNLPRCRFGVSSVAGVYPDLRGSSHVLPR
jgi:hypothetical protein